MLQGFNTLMEMQRFSQFIDRGYVHGIIEAGWMELVKMVVRWLPDVGIFNPLLRRDAIVVIRHLGPS